jgi:hypothetical protein
MGERPLPRVLFPLATSIATTALIAWAAVRSLRSAALADTGKFIAVFASVLGANAVLSFSYTKDEIISPAGVFYALAAFAVMRELLTVSAGWRPPVRLVCTVFLCLLTIGWTFRSVGVHILMRTQAIKHQNDWAPLPFAWQRNDDWPEEPEAQQLILQLRREAIALPLPNTRVDEPEWPSRLWLDD